MPLRVGRPSLKLPLRDRQGILRRLQRVIGRRQHALGRDDLVIGLRHRELHVEHARQRRLLCPRGGMLLTRQLGDGARLDQRDIEADRRLQLIVGLNLNRGGPRRRTAEERIRKGQRAVVLVANVLARGLQRGRQAADGLCDLGALLLELGARNLQRAVVVGGAFQIGVERGGQRGGDEKCDDGKHCFPPEET